MIGIGKVILKERSKFLSKEIEKDLLFYDESGGGVTFSGGEPLGQPEFLLELLKICKKNEINTILDTTGHTDSKILDKIKPYVDLFLYDLKFVEGYGEINKSVKGELKSVKSGDYVEFYLKNGESSEGKIIEKTLNFLVVELDNIVWFIERNSIKWLRRL